MKNLYSLIFLFFCLTIDVQAEGTLDSIQPTVFFKEDYHPIRDSLKKEWGKNKVFLDKLELQALIALSYYPELKDVKITFVRKNLNSSMAARPRILSTLRKRGKRKYLVLLDDYDAKVPFDSTTFNAQVGVIGHELGHIAYYESKSSWNLMGLPIKYLNKTFRSTFEKDTDKAAILHGLGWQLYAWKLHSEAQASKHPDYLAYKSRFYLSSKIIYQLTLDYFKALKKDEE